MGRLVYSAICSLDGYTNGVDGRFEWAAPDAAEHAAVNDLERDVETYLYGRRMYEVMRFWDQPMAEDEDPVALDYQRVWRGADKVVYSSSLPEVTTPRTRLERRFDVDAVRSEKEAASGRISIGGPTLAAAALAAGLVDDLWLLLLPLTVGGGTRALPDGLGLALDLQESRRFERGSVLLRYTVRPSPRG
ncbi:dihydrofolate reductase family protein [Amnibacterium sp. CER49]|uniref:dihydrofolate reductase family protein n=1 Tax=Amnibacterium sp. CER49 TaxID=3039161 RepID=UPI002448A816|nr:dihydrofolate reductase family protein [Amnibacterium sp. CER49]MDH2444970.1 dihydrofolate reductase family protein [Amnibacterium sp. CER49]